MSYNFIFCKQFLFIISDLKIIGHENPYNNLESPYSFSVCRPSFDCVEVPFRLTPI
jgi:hypothetical protein